MIDPDGIVDFYDTFDRWVSPLASGLKIQRLEQLLQDLGKEIFPHGVIGKWLKKTKWLTSRRYGGYRLAETFPNYDEQVETLIDKLTEATYAGRWVGSPSYSYKAQMAFARNFSREKLAEIFRSFLFGLVRPVLESSGKKMFIEDDSWNMMFAKELLEIVPEAKFLHVYRDPRDVVTSFITKNWCPTDLDATVKFYKPVIRRCRLVAKSLPRDRILEIGIEEIVERPREKLGLICSHFGLSFDENMLNVGLVASSFGRWKRELTAAQCNFVDSALADEIRDLGY